jgi:hypothetical protein
MLLNMPNERDPEPAPDPRALRALAHPLRWKLIDLLGSETTATATRCAEILGESVASCSYHLGILGKYGYAEVIPDQPGREKPWRLAGTEQNLSPAGLDVEGTLASEQATEVFLDHEIARLKDRLRRQGLEPEPWRRASRMLGVTTWMTARELCELSEQLMQILARHADRISDRSLRPEGAREVRLFAATSVAPPPARGARS